MTNAHSTTVVRARDLPAPIEYKADDLPKEVMGQPCHYFWKAMLKPGVYHHPNYRADIEFTRADMADADRYTRAWIKDGGQPAIPVHGHKGKNLGWIKDTRWDGEALWGLHQFIGDDAVREASRHGTSVGFARNFKSGDKTYPCVIEHNALVFNPVAPGLGNFVALSRTDGGPAQQVPVYELISAAERTMNMTPEQLAMSREILGQPELPEAEALEQIIGAARLAEDYFDELKVNKVELSRTAEALAEAKTKIAAQTVEMSRATTPAKPSASELHWASRAVQAEKDKAIRAGAITPAVAAKAEERFLRKPVDFTKVTLDREVEDDDHKIASGLAQLMAFYETVQGNTPRQKAGEVTGRQEVIPMDRSVPGGDDNKKDRQVELLMEQLGTKK